MSVSSDVVWWRVEVSATSWSLVQRSPTDCGVSQMCVIVKPRRNEEAQAHIGLSSHRKKKCSINPLSPIFKRVCKVAINACYLRHVYLSVCSHVIISAASGQVFVKFCSEDFY
jgi:hypothetical protein